MSVIEREPLVSVGIATYNRPDGLKRTLKCITEQTYRNLEIVVSNDCSPTEKTEEIIRMFMERDSRIKYYYQKKNITSFKNINFVLEKSTGEYFMWADDDDEWDKYFIEKCLLNIGDCTSAMCSTRTFFEETGKMKRGELPDWSPEYSAYRNVRTNILNFSTPLYYGLHKRNDMKWFIDIQPFDFLDYFLATKLLLDGNGVVIIRNYTGYQNNVIETGKDRYKPVKPDTNRCFLYKPFIQEHFKLISSSFKLSGVEKIILKTLIVWKTAALYAKYEKQYKPIRVKLVKIMLRQIRSIIKLQKILRSLHFWN